MKTKDRRRWYVFGVDLPKLAQHIWQALGTDRPLPHIEWWMTNHPRPHGLAWPELHKARISIPWHRPHIVLVAEIILHELIHCALPPEVDDHGLEFRDLLEMKARDLWGVDPTPLSKFIGGGNDPEYTLDRQIEAAMMIAYTEGFLMFDGEHGEMPEVCRRCDTAYPGPTRCCGVPSKPL